MQISPEDLRSLDAKIRSHWNATYCEGCGSNAWQIANEIFELRPYNGGSFVVGGPIVPIVPVFCTNCGLVRLVSAIILGVNISVVRQPEMPPMFSGRGPVNG